MFKRPIQFAGDAIGESGIAQHDDRAHRMREAAQMLLLFLAQCHAPIIVAT